MRVINACDATVSERRNTNQSGNQFYEHSIQISDGCAFVSFRTWRNIGTRSRASLGALSGRAFGSRGSADRQHTGRGKAAGNVE